MMPQSLRNLRMETGVLAWYIGMLIVDSGSVVLRAGNVRTKTIRGP